MFSVPAALFIYASTRPTARLSPDMPRGFVDPLRHASARQRASEERVAQAYWDCVVTLIQWKYTYGSELPDDPPDDFEIGALAGATPKADQGSRVRYWHRLQKLWNSPDAWVTWRGWSTRWLTDPLGHGVEGIQTYFRDLIKTG